MLKDENEKDVKEIGEELKKNLKKARKATPEVKQKIGKIVLKSVILITIIIVYFSLLTYACHRIELDILDTILKISGGIFLILAIICYEIAYKKSKEIVFLTGVELNVISFISLFMTSLTDDYNTFRNVMIITEIIATIYYLIKAFVLTRKVKKQYKQSTSDVRKIIEEDN